MTDKVKVWMAAGVVIIVGAFVICAAYRNEITMASQIAKHKDYKLLGRFAPTFIAYSTKMRRSGRTANEAFRC
jgi:hypothetical protein